MTHPEKRAPIRPDWVSKTVAGQLLGFVLGVAASDLFMRLGPDGALGNRAQLAMWIVAPVWMGVASLCYLFRSGTRAWLWLGAACTAAILPLAAERLL